MPKQKSRVRRKAAPVNLAEPDVMVDEGEASLPEIYRPPQRRRNPRAKSSMSVTDEQNSYTSVNPNTTSSSSVNPNTNIQVMPTSQPAPSANEIVTLVIQKLSDMPDFRNFNRGSQNPSAVGVEESSSSRQTVHRLQLP